MQKPSKFAAWLSTFLFCLLFWLLLTLSLAPREIFWGVIISAIVAAFANRFLIHHKAFYLYNPVRLVLLVVYCCTVFLWEVIKANVNMAKIVLSPSLRNYQAGIIRVPGSPDVKSEYGLAMVSNCITLTPGTITMDVAEDEQGNNYYYVHWIDVAETDRDKAGEAIKGRMERWIGRIWK